MTKEKLISFLDLFKKDIVHFAVLVEEYPKFMESDYQNAYDYFKSKGMIIEVQQPLTDVQICKLLIKSILAPKDSSLKNEMLSVNEEEKDIDYLKKYHIRNVLYNSSVLNGEQMSTDPRRVKNILDELLSDYNN